MSGHSRGDIIERYDQHKNLDEMQRAFEALSAQIDRIVDPPEGEVIRCGGDDMPRKPADCCRTGKRASKRAIGSRSRHRSQAAWPEHLLSPHKRGRRERAHDTPAMLDGIELLVRTAMRERGISRNAALHWWFEGIYKKLKKHGADSISSPISALTRTPSLLG